MLVCPTMTDAYIVKTVTLKRNAKVLSLLKPQKRLMHSMIWMLMEYPRHGTQSDGYIRMDLGVWI